MVRPVCCVKSSRQNGKFFIDFTVDITVWKKVWRMCKSLKNERFMKVTSRLWEKLRNNIFPKVIPFGGISGVFAGDLKERMPVCYNTQYNMKIQAQACFGGSDGK